MPKCSLVFALSTTVCLSCVTSGAATIDKAPVLPLKTLRIYEGGVGYFERTGRLSSSTATTLPVPASHLDDALKTLVILNQKGAGIVHGLEFGSLLSQGMARAQAGLPLDANVRSTYRTLLESLKGAQVEMRAARGNFRGRIVEVVAPVGKVADKAADNGAQKKEPEFRVVLLTEDAALRQFVAEEIEWVRPLASDSTSRLTSVLDASSPKSAQVRRALGVLGEASGEVTLGYIAETPIWQATYRLVLDPSGKSGALQGWALLHNDSDEDWRGVRIHLVNGKPSSFLYPLAAPRYFRRPMLHPANKLSTVPQLLRTTADSMWGDHLDEDDNTVNALGNLEGNEIGEAYGVGGLGMVGTGAGGGGTGEATFDTQEMVEVSPAAGVESAALFVYSLAHPLTLNAHSSALVPVLASSIEARSMVWFDKPAETGSNVVRFTNSTAQTLPGGPIAFFSEAGFAGESILGRLKPGQHAYLRHGIDLDVQIKEKASNRVEEVVNLTFDNGHLVEHLRVKQTATYEFENRSGQARTLALVLAAGANAKVVGADETDMDGTSAHPAAIFLVPGRSRTQRPITFEENLLRNIEVGSLTWAWLNTLQKSDSLSAKTRSDLAAVSVKQRELEASLGTIARMKSDVDEVEKDLVRLRKDLEALGEKTGPEGAAPFVKRILAGEDKLDELRRRKVAADKEVETLRASVRAALAELAKV